ncbi:MAG: hypothetical protein ACREN2_04285 [Candidatus Dormibacteria bacterium]
MMLGACGGTSAPGGRLPLASATPTPIPHLPQASLHNTGAPPARFGAALGFDVVTRQLILFGGATAGDQAHPADAVRLADTWAWDGHSWTQLHPAMSPPALYGARLVDDPATGHLLLVSGSGTLDSTGALQQMGVWLWGGQNWSRIADNPLQMQFAAVGSDQAHRQVLLSGFDNGYLLNCGGRLNCPVLQSFDKPGAYQYGGGHWMAAPGTAPQFAEGGTAYDPNSQQLISAGGLAQNGLESTYGWDGKQWHVVSQSQGYNGVPDPAYPAGPCDAATDADAGNLVMACSFTDNGKATGATWTFDGTNWTRAQQATTVLPAIPSISLADDLVAGAVIMVYPGTGTEAMKLWNGSDWLAIS